MQYLECLWYLESKGEELLDGELSLDRIQAVVTALGNPHLAVPTVLVAGTNAKGSVSRFVAAIASAAGLKVGLFTSPHLVRLRERIRVGGHLIDRSSFARHCSRVAVASLETGHALTYFETLAATAFCAFRSARVDIAILEVGLGGRLDATNVTDPLLAVLTPISYDHQNYLGDTLEAIAGEKLGIARPRRPIVSAPQRPGVDQVLRARSQELDAPVVRVGDVELDRPAGGRYGFRYRGRRYQPLMRGRFQPANAALAVETALQLRNHFSIDDEAIRVGISQALSPGVLQTLPVLPPVMLDGGHNPQAARRLAGFVRQHTSPPRRLLFALMADKDAAGVAGPLAPLFDEVVLTEVASRRGAPAVELRRYFPSASVEPDPVIAYRRLCAGKGLLVVAGSFQLAGRIAAEEGL